MPIYSSRMRARRRASAVVVAVGLLASVFGQAEAQVGFEVGVSKFHTPTWGTNRIEGTPYSGRVWDIIEHNGVAYIGGEFTSLAPTLELAGALDGASGLPTPGFPKIDENTAARGEVKVAVPDGEGGWYVGGSFRKINGETRNGLARIKADGTVDTRWTPSIAVGQSPDFTVWSMAKWGPHIYVGGKFTKFQGTSFDPQGKPRNNIAKLASSTGTVDAAWNADANGPVKSIAVSADGSRVYISGEFTALKGGTVPRNGLAALQGAGLGDVLDWQPPVGTVNSLATSLDNSRIYVGGDTLAAVDPAGAVAWNLPGGKVRSIALSRDGSTLFAGGDFTSVGGQPRARLAAVTTATGAVDAAWNPTADGEVAAVTVSEDDTKVYVGGSFDTVRDRERHKLAALDAVSGTLEAWNPNSNGDVVALSASGAQVYAGGQFNNLGSQPRSMLGAIDTNNGGISGWAPVIEQRNPGDPPPIVQALALSADGSRIFIGGNFSHVNGVLRENLAAVDRATGQTTDTSFNPGRPLGTVRSLAVYGNTLYAGGDFKQVLVSGTNQGTGRPDNPCPSGRSDCTPKGTKGTSSTWDRGGLVAAFNATTGILDLDFNQTPESTGPGLIGQQGKLCQPGEAGCGNGAVKAIALSDDGRFLYASGTFSDLGGQLGMYATNRVDGSFTDWQPKLTIPVFDVATAPDGQSLVTATGGAGGRIQRFQPHSGPDKPVWEHVFDGDATAVGASGNAFYSGGHYDWVDGGLYKRKHASAFDLNGNIAMNFDPEIDTNEGVFVLKVVPGRMVLYGGNFSRVNRRAQPGYAQFVGTP